MLFTHHAKRQGRKDHLRHPHAYITRLPTSSPSTTSSYPPPRFSTSSHPHLSIPNFLFSQFPQKKKIKTNKQSMDLHYERSLLESLFWQYREQYPTLNQNGLEWNARRAFWVRYGLFFPFSFPSIPSLIKQYGEDGWEILSARRC